ncbi:GNAT family N-acetyltransferase [Ferrimonas senticii]|uniref:GNAT family N-acetyltransferase n=1 Tax=Ferrimonas senticii TaxID=394566 RepID=UPI000403282F|nr:hypothetical protein [Ferrimonas senticii]
MQIVQVDDHNIEVYLNLAQGYEAEFSKIVQKKPQADGRFALDTELGGNVAGYLLYVDGVPAGHTAIASHGDGQFEVCDFYVVPYFRQNRLGQTFAAAIFAMHGGRWQIKQVAGADRAIAFWQATIGDYTGGHFKQDIYQDPQWGTVTRQCFNHLDFTRAY